MSTDSVPKSKSVQGSASTPKPGASTTPSGRKRKRHRSSSLEMEIRASARVIYKQGYADAMKAAALMIVSRKLDEIKALLQVTGVNASIPTVTQFAPQIPMVNTQPQLAPVVKNPCVQCGREGVYRSKPSQWNRTGSWFCRTHQVIATTAELEDRMDRAIQPQAPPIPPSALQPAPTQPAPGASSLSEAMGLAEVTE